MEKIIFFLLLLHNYWILKGKKRKEMDPPLSPFRPMEAFVCMLKQIKKKKDPEAASLRHLYYLSN